MSILEELLLAVKYGKITEKEFEIFVETKEREKYLEFLND